jgi:hypothetical protein
MRSPPANPYHAANIKTKGFATMTTLTHIRRSDLQPAASRTKPYFLLIFAVLLLAIFALKTSDLSAAHLAAPLRHIIGNEAVAQLETWLFGAQDAAKQFSHEVGLAEAAAPWQPPALALMPTATAVPLPSPTASPPPLPTAVPTFTIDNSQLTIDDSPTSTAIPPTPTPLPTPTPWQPAAMPPLGSLAGEAVWSPYITLPGSDQVAAFRAFLQPDPERPFTVVAVVAFDLNAVQLNYVLGSEEPSLPDGVRGNGRIPADHKTPDMLLAAFNGGFMATHGEYGAMANGVMPLPAKDGLATVALGQDGRIHIGKWGESIDPAGDWLAWRQNAYLVVAEGAITPETEANSLYYWSGSINNEVVTWRSGLGLSADGRTLYYFAGPSLNMPALGRAMVTAGVEQGMLLDINAYWVHFTAMRALEDGTLTADPLLTEMEHHAARFLQKYQRDFFYITTLDASSPNTNPGGFK